MRFLSLLFAVFLSIGTFAQSKSEMSILDMPEKSICWLGLDFTMAKMVGSHGFQNPNRVKAEFLLGWNKFFYEEPKKYDIEDAFDFHRKKELKLRTVACERRNGKIPLEGLVTEESHFITPKMVREKAKTYDYSESKEDIGILFMVESFSKIDELATVWVVLVDIKKGEPFFIREMIGKPSGFGVKNYWGGAIADIIYQIEDTYYEAWTQDLNKKERKGMAKN